MACQKISFVASSDDLKLLNTLKSDLSSGNTAILRAALKEYYDRHKKDEYAELYKKTPQKADIYKPIDNRCKIRDGIGLYNRKRVIEWKFNNKWGMGKDCAKDLNMGRTSVYRHLNALKKEDQNEKLKRS